MYLSPGVARLKAKSKSKFFKGPSRSRCGPFFLRSRCFTSTGSEIFLLRGPVAPGIAPESAARDSGAAHAQWFALPAWLLLQLWFNPQVPVTAVASASVHGHSETTRAAVATMHNTTASIDASNQWRGVVFLGLDLHMRHLPNAQCRSPTGCSATARPASSPNAQRCVFIRAMCPSLARVCLCACGAFVLGRDPASAPASARRSCTCTSWLNRAGGCSFGGNLSL